MPRNHRSDDTFADTWPTTMHDTIQPPTAWRDEPSEDTDGLGAARGIVALVAITVVVMVIGCGVWVL